MLAVRAPGGALRAILFGYACHTTAVYDYRINGDYAGYAQSSLGSRLSGRHGDVHGRVAAATSIRCRAGGRGWGRAAAQC